MIDYEIQVTQLVFGRTEGIVFIIGILIGIAGIVILLPSDPVVFTGDIELDPSSYIFRGYLDGVDDSQLHSIRILENPVNMHVVLKCGSNDFDVYIGQGYTPTTTDYDVRGFAAGGEDFTYEYLEEGICHFMVHSYTGAGQYELRIDIEY